MPSFEILSAGPTRMELYPRNPTLSLSDFTCALGHIVGALLLGDLDISAGSLGVEDDHKVGHIHEVEALCPNEVDGAESVLESLHGDIELVV